MAYPKAFDLLGRGIYPANPAVGIGSGLTDQKAAEVVRIAATTRAATSSKA